MTNKIEPPRLLIWITLAILVVGTGLGYYFFQSKLPEGIVIKTKGQPTLGYPKAAVHVVVFEEPKCSNCKKFNLEVFPKLKKEFIDTNKILYTIIPVAFLPGSMPAAVSLLCVYYADPLYPNDEIFFTYLDYMYEHQPEENTDWSTTDKLIEFAKDASPAISTDKLKKCIEMDTYRVKIEQNTDYGRQVMGGRLMTPTVFVNGIEVEELSYDSVSKLIREVLEHEGVY